MQSKRITAKSVFAIFNAQAGLFGNILSVHSIYLNPGRVKLNRGELSMYCSHTDCDFSVRMQILPYTLLQYHEKLPSMPNF